MSKYEKEPLDLSELKTISLTARGGKVKAADFAIPYQRGGGVAGWLDSLPRILAADSFRAVVDAVVARHGARMQSDSLGHGRPCHQMRARARVDRPDAPRLSRRASR